MQTTSEKLAPPKAPREWTLEQIVLALEVRQAKRLLGSKWELKCQDLTWSLIDKLLSEMSEPEDLRNAGYNDYEPLDEE